MQHLRINDEQDPPWRKMTSDRLSLTLTGAGEGRDPRPLGELLEGQAPLPARLGHLLAQHLGRIERLA
jgi:hypothetical protein